MAQKLEYRLTADTQQAIKNCKQLLDELNSISVSAVAAGGALSYVGDGGNDVATAVAGIDSDGIKDVASEAGKAADRVEQIGKSGKESASALTKLGSRGVSALKSVGKGMVTVMDYIDDNLDETVATAAKVREDGYTVVLAGVDGRTVGFAVLSDTLKDDSVETVADMRSLGLKTIMLTGDTHQVARKMADTLGMDDVVWECLPEDKLRTVVSLEGSGRTCMVGDGINDAPSLKRADVGIAMGGIGNEMATESADIVFVDDDISKIGGVVRLSRRTLLTIKAGITFSIVLNSVAMVMAVFGLMGPIAGALVHNIGSVIVIIMAALLLRYDCWRPADGKTGASGAPASPA